MPRITAEGGPQSDGVPAAPRQKGQIGPVGVIHQKGHIPFPADFPQSGNVLDAAQIVRRGEVNPKGLFPLPRQSVQLCFQLGRGHRAAAQVRPLALRGPEPMNLKIQQSRCIEQCFVGVAGRQQHRPTLGGRRRLKSQKQHRPDALGRALGAVKSPSGAKEVGSVFLTLGDDPLCLIELVRALNLGDIQRLAPQRPPAFVPGHMQPGDFRPGVAAHKFRDGGVHSAQPSPAQAEHSLPSWTGTSMPWAASSWLSATLIMMAHSIRFLNSSQPYS